MADGVSGAGVEGSSQIQTPPQEKIVDATVDGNGIYDQTDIGDVNLRPDQFQAKKKEMFEKLIDSPDYKKAILAFQAELALGNQLSDFFRSNLNLNNPEPLSPEATQSMMERWLKGDQKPVDTSDVSPSITIDSTQSPLDNIKINPSIFNIPNTGSQGK